MIGRILGTGSGMPTEGRSHSALWLRIAEHNVLIDCGEGTAQKLLEYDLTGDLLDTIVISHFHPDHSAGIFMVLQMFHLQRRRKPLTLYLPEGIDNFITVLATFYLFPARLPFELIIKDVNTIQNDIKEIVPIRNKHLESYREFIEKNSLHNLMNSYSFFISTGNKTLLFTSDIESIEHLNDYPDKSSIIIVDGLHPPLEDILYLMKDKQRKVILIHGESSSLVEILDKKELNENGVQSEYIIAKDGYQINV